MAVKQKTGPWFGAKKTANAAAGRSKAESDRRLQQQAEAKRKDSAQTNGGEP